MLNIKDRLFLSIFINNIELPLNTVVFRQLQMHSATLFNFPIAVLTVADSVNYLVENPIVDGDSVTVRCGKVLENAYSQSYSFRVFNVKTAKIGNSKVYTFYLILNAPRYVNENSKASITGRVSDVIRELAEVSGLEYDIDITADSQIWYSGGAKRCDFAKYVTRHAYLDTTSCFVLGVTLGGQVRLKNISNLDYVEASNLLLHGPKISEASIQVVGLKESVESGFQNNLSGYKYETVVQTNENVSRESQVEVPATSTVLNVNSLLNERLEGSRLYFGPIDSGNTHPNFYVAEHQNKRIKSTFGSSIFVVCNEESNLDLLDTTKFIDFENPNSRVELNQKTSGGYLTTAKSLLIQPGYYFEKMKLTRQGFNADIVTQENLQLLGVG